MCIHKVSVDWHQGARKRRTHNIVSRQTKPLSLRVQMPDLLSLNLGDCIHLKSIQSNPVRPSRAYYVAVCVLLSTCIPDFSFLRSARYLALFSNSCLFVCFQFEAAVPCLSNVSAFSHEKLACKVFACTEGILQISAPNC